jgi:hypothetical protein
VRNSAGGFAVKDPYLPQILGLLAAGVTSTALAVSGYLHQPETVRLLGTQLTYQAAYRKLPLSLMGTGLCVSAWLLTQTRRDYGGSIRSGSVKRGCSKVSCKRSPSRRS